MTSNAFGGREADYYASTPLAYDAAVDSIVAFDQGDVPLRKAIVTIPVTAGQIFSFAALTDAGEACRNGPAVTDSGSALVDWEVYPWNAGPWVTKIVQSGDLDIEIAPCASTGTFQLVSTTIGSSVVTETGTTPDGHPTTTSHAIFEATRPGQVAIVEYDAGNDLSNRVDVSAVASTFPAGTEVWFGQGLAEENHASGFGADPADSLTTTLYNLRDRRYLYLYAGPTATGSLDVELVHMAF